MDYVACQAPLDGAYRQYLPDLSIPRFTTNAEAECARVRGGIQARRAAPWLHALHLHWRDLLKEPYRGITNDGERKS